MFDNYLDQMDPATIPGMGGLEQAMSQNQRMAPQQQERGPHGLGHILGLIGATIASARGRPAPYFEQLMQMKQEQKQQQANQAFANYLGDPELAALITGGADPGTAMRAYGIKHPQEKSADTPSAVREYEFYSQLPPDKQAIYRRFRQISRPQLIGSPAAGYSVYDPEGEGEPEGEAPTVNSQEEYDALPPGAHYRDSQGNAGVKRGGQTASPSGVFPGQ